MTLLTLILQVVLTIPLTMILYYCKNKNNRKFDLLIIPTIYIIIVSALIPKLKENVYLIVIFEIFIRNFYITNITLESNKDSAFTFLIDSLVSVAISVFAYTYFIGNVSSVIPDPETIKALVWFVIIIYLMSLYKTNTKDKEKVKKEKQQLFKKEYIIMQYAKYKNKYSKIVKSKNILINNLTYSIMIYETGKTPMLNRKIEEYIGAITKTDTKYGIMRIRSFNHLTDEESIKAVVEDLEKKAKNKDKLKPEMLLTNYDESEVTSIINIYNEIVEFSKK